MRTESMDIDMNDPKNTEIMSYSVGYCLNTLIIQPPTWKYSTCGDINDDLYSIYNPSEGNNIHPFLNHLT